MSLIARGKLGLRVQFSLRGVLVTAVLVAIVSRIYVEMTDRRATEAVLALAFLGAPLLGLYFTSLFQWRSEGHQLTIILVLAGVVASGLYATILAGLIISDAWEETLAFSLVYLMMLALFWSPQILLLFERMDRVKIDRHDQEPDFSHVKID